MALREARERIAARGLQCAAFMSVRSNPSNVYIVKGVLIMNMRCKGRWRAATVVFSTGLLLALVPACKKEAESPVKLPAGLVTFQAQIDQTNAQLQGTIAALESVIAASGESANTELEKFASALSALDTQAAATKSAADDMRAKGKTYFEAWETQLGEVSTPAIKEAAEKRRDELTKNYEAVTQSMGAARDAFNPLLSDLKDLHKILKNDLSAEGRAGLATNVAKLKDASKALGQTIEVVKTNLTKIAAVYSAKVS